MEPCSRSVVLASQVLAGMWKRNGYGVLNQALHYQLHLSRAVMYDKDIIMLQVCICTSHPVYLSISIYLPIYLSIYQYLANEYSSFLLRVWLRYWILEYSSMHCFINIVWRNGWSGKEIYPTNNV